MKDSSPVKRPASPSSSQPVTPRKRQRITLNAESTPWSSSRTSKTPRSKKKKDPPVWQDIPKEWTHKKCLLLELLPVELLDNITDSNSQLELQDHVSLAGTCHTLRRAYTEKVWKALLMNPTSPAIKHIFSSGFEASQHQEFSEEKGKTKKQDLVATISYREKVAEAVNIALITKTVAMQTFKISRRDMIPLKFETKCTSRTNRQRCTYPAKLYVTAQVRALALRIHAHIKRRAEIAEKSKATKAKNGTTPKKKALMATNFSMAFTAAMIDAFLVMEDADGNEFDADYEYEDEFDTSPP